MRITRAQTGGISPMPANSTNRISRPRVGRARSAPAKATTATLPLPVCPTNSPTGTAMAVAISMTSPVYCRCSPSRAGMPMLPDQFTGSASQATVSEKTLLMRSLPFPLR